MNKQIAENLSGGVRATGLSYVDKVLLESVLGMSGGYVLDFSNDSFAEFFQDLDINIYDTVKYPGAGGSKANRLRALWRSGTDEEVSTSLFALVDYIYAKKLTGFQNSAENVAKIERLRTLAEGLSATDAAQATSLMAVNFTTEATVTENRIQIEIHDDIYAHIKLYLAAEDYFHAVEESYKVVRKALWEKTGSERATDAFRLDNQTALFGNAPTTDAEKDFFDGVKYLNMAIQFLRNEKSHTLAIPIERNLALHYISLASLSYDLITRYVSEELIERIENLVLAERRSYSATRFYPAFEGGKWIEGFIMPAELESLSVRRVLKAKWLEEVDFTRSWDHSNVVLMRLELVADVLASDDLDTLLDRPTVDSNGYHQEAGLLPFFEFMKLKYPDRISLNVSDWMAAKNREYESD